MEIRNLTAFLQVAAMNSFTKAGESLGYSQSNISLQIRQLETEIGVPLFDRIGKKANLTQYGQILVPYAQQIVSTATQISNLFSQREMLSGTIRVGFVESLFETLFNETISNYHQQYPNVTIEVTVDATSELLKMLRSSQLDFVCLIDSCIVAPDISYLAMEPCNVVIVANPAHPLCGKTGLLPQDLRDQDFIMMEDTAPYVLDFEKRLFDEQVQINSFLKVQSPEAALKLIGEANYLSFLPDYSVKKAVQRGEAAVLNVAGFPCPQTVQFLTHKNKVLTPQIEGFVENARSTFLKYVMED